MSNGAKKRFNVGRSERNKRCKPCLGAGGRCRIRTRVVGFEARQDIQATLIARNPSEMATLLE